MSTLPELFRKSIAKGFLIDREDKDYVLEENRLKYKFRSPSNKVIGFRVEQQDLELFSGSPLEGIGKFCDALFIVRYKKKDFIIAVEIKTAHKNSYKKQLRNGCRLCEWLVQLYKDHQHYSDTPPQYVGLLIRADNPGGEGQAETMAVGDFAKNSHPATAPLNAIFEYDETTISLQALLKKVA